MDLGELEEEEVDYDDDFSMPPPGASETPDAERDRWAPHG